MCVEKRTLTCPSSQIWKKVKYASMFSVFTVSVLWQNKYNGIFLEFGNLLPILFYLGRD